MSKSDANIQSSPCPCGSSLFYEECCGRILESGATALGAEQLMRSRYTAFYLGHSQYLFDTSSASLQSQLTVEALQVSCDQCQFIKLDVLNYGENWVEFIAHLIADDEYQQLHEKSQFVREGGEWKYDTGELFPTPRKRLKRNDDCPCTSGKKYKKCHMR